MKKLTLLMSMVMSSIPLLTFAQFAKCEGASGLLGVLCVIGNILAYIIPILISLAVVYFMWGVIQYLISDNEEKKKKSKGVILSGIIGLFIIVSIWGIINLIINTLGVGPEKLNERAIPCIPNEAAGIECK